MAASGVSVGPSLQGYCHGGLVTRPPPKVFACPVGGRVVDCCRKIHTMRFPGWAGAVRSSHGGGDNAPGWLSKSPFARDCNVLVSSRLKVMV